MNAQPEQEPVARVRLLQFLTDVVTAAGLLAHGKRDKGLSERISKESFEMRRIAAPPPSKPDVNQELVEALRDMVLIFTPAAKDSTAANLIEKATSLIAKHKEQE